MQQENEDSINAAAMNVAETPELVEMILMQLPLPSILLCQRVNCTWRDIIKQSPKLQCALFFRPVSEELLTCVDKLGIALDCSGHKHCDKERRDSLLRTYKKGEAASPWAFVAQDNSEYSAPTINPFMDQAYVDLVGICPATLHMHSTLPRDRPKSPPEASWRRMLISQPPLREAIVDNGRAHHWHRVKVAEGQAGITLQDMRNNAVSFNSLIPRFAVMETPTSLRKRVNVSGEAMVQALTNRTL